MTKQILAIAAIAAALAFPSVAYADETGMVGSAITGAVVGGPIGAVVGAVVGDGVTDHRYHRHCHRDDWGNRHCNY